MIRLYSGTPGSGKSLHNAKDVINRSRFGKPVIGNFPCDLSRFPKANYTYVPNYELTPDYLMNYSREYFKGKPIREGRILLVIDECQLMFNSRDWQQKGRNECVTLQYKRFGTRCIKPAVPAFMSNARLAPMAGSGTAPISFLSLSLPDTSVFAGS